MANYLTPGTLKNELAQVVDEIFLHPVRSFEIQASGEADGVVPSITVSYTYLVVERSIDD